MHNMLAVRNGDSSRANSRGDGVGTSPSMVEVLWRRRVSLVLTIVLCVSLACVYLSVATRIFSATAKVHIDEAIPKVFSDKADTSPRSDNFLQTQADAIESAPILSSALDAVGYRELKTFAGLKGDPVAWLRSGTRLQVELGRKSDTISITVQSPYPEEAAGIANGIAGTYLTDVSRQVRTMGQEMVRALDNEKQDLQHQRDADLQAMLKFKRKSGVTSFGDDKGNIVLERTASLSSSLTAAEVATMDLRAQLEAVKAALADPKMLAAFVQSQQSKGRDFGDREYDELRSQLVQYSLSLSTSAAIQGTNNRRMLQIQSVIDSLKQRIVEKEQGIAQSFLVSISSQLLAAEEKERQIREALQVQRGVALDQSPEAVEYAKLAGQVEWLQRQCDLLDSRIAEVRVNSVEASPKSVRLLESASIPEAPIKPSKTLVLATALMVGTLFGTSLAVLREWKDACLRTPEEILTLLRTPVVAVVPRINSKLSSSTRGQLVRLDNRSVAAEAYRGIRTALQLGSGGSAKTLVLASPTPGDGKSITASNLAISFAQAGELTLLIDCDLRQPVQHIVFEMSGEVGLSSVLAGDTKLRQAIFGTEVPGLFVMPSGPIPENPSELLTGKRFARLIRALSGKFDRIVIDSPPLMNVTDGQILGAMADATLLVLRMNRSVRQLGASALDGLAKVGANVLGAVANDVPVHGSHRYYGSSWQYAPEEKPRLFTSKVFGEATGDVAAGDRKVNGMSDPDQAIITRVTI